MRLIVSLSLYNEELNLVHGIVHPRLEFKYSIDQEGQYILLEDHLLYHKRL